MAVLLALLAALSYGGGDFAGGLASRRAGAVQVLLVTTPVGLALIAVAAVLVPADPTRADLLWGAVAGLAGGAALPLFYAALAAGPMTVVAPVSALTAAVIPVGAGLALGDRIGVLALAGVVVCLAAIILVSLEPAALEASVHAPAGRRGLLLSLGAGVGFGLFFVLLSFAGDDAGLWTLVTARTVAIGTTVVVAVATGALSLRAARVRLTYAAAAGDALANVFFVLALEQGLLSLVAVITSLYPAGTVLLARLVLHEKLNRQRLVGLGLAAIGAVMVGV